eukprot:c42191_g1_i1 orf=55-237(+)
MKRPVEPSSTSTAEGLLAVVWDSGASLVLMLSATKHAQSDERLLTLLRKSFYLQLLVILW